MLKTISIYDCSPQVKRAFITVYHPSQNELDTCCYYHLFIYALDGEADITIDGAKKRVLSGDLFYIPPGMVYQIIIHKKATLAFVCFSIKEHYDLEFEFTSRDNFESDVYIEPEYLFNECGCLPKVYHGGHHSELRDIFTKACSAEPKVTAFNHCCYAGYLYLVFHHILHPASGSEDGNDNQGREVKLNTHLHIISSATKYIVENLHLPLSLADITAACCDYSEIYFGRIFKQYTGKTPFEYILDRRIETAKLLLKIKWQATIKEIGYECGFEQPKYFLIAFKKNTGKTPSQYRCENIN